MLGFSTGIAVKCCPPSRLATSRASGGWVAVTGACCDDGAAGAAAAGFGAEPPHPLTAIPVMMAIAARSIQLLLMLFIWFTSYSCLVVPGAAGRAGILLLPPAPWRTGDRSTRSRYRCSRR